MWKKSLSLHTSQVAHQAGAYPGFCSMKRLGVLLLPPGWDASPSQGYPPALYLPVLFYTPGWSEAMRGYSVLPNNTMTPVRTRTQTARSRVNRTNHEATAPPTALRSKHYRPERFITASIASYKYSAHQGKVQKLSVDITEYLWIIWRAVMFHSISGKMDVW